MALLACRTDGPSEPQGLARVLVTRGLEQEVRLTPRQPRTGDTLTVWSVIRNRGPVAVHYEARICGLDRRTNLEFGPDAVARCGGYSMSGSIARGDSIVGAEWLGVITSPPGAYTVQIRHLLDPEVWVRIQVDVGE